MGKIGKIGKIYKNRGNMKNKQKYGKKFVIEDLFVRCDYNFDRFALIFALDKKNVV